MVVCHGAYPSLEPGLTYHCQLLNVEDGPRWPVRVMVTPVIILDLPSFSADDIRKSSAYQQGHACIL